MPINNDFYGVYKFATIRTTNSTLGTGKNPYIIKDIGDNEDMDVKAIFYMQGTPLTKVLDIGGTSQDFSVNADVLVPIPNSTTTVMDGLQLLNDLTALQYTGGFPNNTLPLMTSASIKIGEQATTVNINLMSDGDPNNSLNVYEIDHGAQAQSHIATTGLEEGLRVAKWYDFFVDIGGLKYFVKSADISIKIKNLKNNFLGVYPENYRIPTDGLNDGTFQYDDSYSGWQFPFIGVGGIEIDINGQAAIAINNITGAAINYNHTDTLITSNVADLLAASNVTLQHTGQFNTTTNNFNIYYTGSSTLSGVLPSFFAINRAVINKKQCKFTADEMVADFSAKLYVGIN